MVQSRLPWLLEAAIRVLFSLYFDTQQQATSVLCFYWTRRAQGVHSQIPNTKRIHKAILQGDDPATIRELQTLRSKLGLNRPIEDYEHLVASLLQDDNQDSDNKDEDENDEYDQDGSINDKCGNANNNASNNTYNKKRMKYFVARTQFELL